MGRRSLHTTLHSLLQQTNPNWKAIVIFDGIKQLPYTTLPQDDRISYLFSEKIGRFGLTNGESGMVRNIGIKAATTEWIGFLDDDDTIAPFYVHALLTKYHVHDFVVWRMIYTNRVVLPPFHANELAFGNVGISFCYNQYRLGKVYFKHNSGGEDFDFLKDLKNRTSNWKITHEIAYRVRH
ncbi:MAG: glycosyltransferase family 2 protein [Bacteroidetes bacterium]|nr:glycosyltransferase family 2 protein [Bacteroidota bacterium]